MTRYLLFIVCIGVWSAAIILDNKFKTNPSCKNYVINTTETYNYLIQETILKCATLCSRDENCSSLNYLKTSSECRLNRQVINSDCSNGYLQPFSLYFEKADQVCLNGGVRVPAITGDCVCNNSYVGERCDRLMYDCHDGVSQYADEVGIFSLRPPGTQQSFEMKCVMKWGGRTIISLNFDNVNNFNRTWQEAVDGYGNSLTNHYWAGLRKLYLLTKNLNRRFCLQIYDGNLSLYRSNCYSNFRIGDESENFQILNAQTWYSNIPKCIDVVGTAFSTYDSDNDNAIGRNCASEYGANWWFGENCSLCNPLGIFTNPKGLPWTGEVHVAHWVGLHYTPNHVNMWIE